MGGAVEGGGVWPVEAPAVESSGAVGRASGAVERGSGAVVTGSGGLGGGVDMIGTELPDTKLVGGRILPGLGRRLYGKEG